MTIGVVASLLLGCAISTFTPTPTHTSFSTPTWTPAQLSGCGGSLITGNYDLEISTEQICLALIEIHSEDVWGLNMWFPSSVPNEIRLFACVAPHTSVPVRAIAEDFVDLVRTADDHTSRAYYIQLHKCPNEELSNWLIPAHNCISSLAFTGYAGVSKYASRDGELRKTGPSRGGGGAYCRR